MLQNNLFKILGVLLVIEVVAVTYYITRPLPVPQPVGSQLEGGAIMELLPAEGKIAIGKSSFVKINLDTGGQATDGARVVLRFDPSKLMVEEINHKIAVYDNYPVELIDNQKGKVVISGVINPRGTPFQGSGTFATLKIKAISTGPASLSFEFTQGETTDSNVALTKSGVDLLVKTDGAVYLITN